MVELGKDVSPVELLKKLLTEHDILIKELTSKTAGKSYLRLAIRDREDNDRIISAFKEVIE